jgi:hypothetical protein
MAIFNSNPSNPAGTQEMYAVEVEWWFRFCRFVSLSPSDLKSGIRNSKHDIGEFTNKKRFRNF